MDWINAHLGEMISFVLGFAGGSLVTLKFSKKQHISNAGNVVDQSRSKVGGDMIGRDKIGKK